MDMQVFHNIQQNSPMYGEFCFFILQPVLILLYGIGALLKKAVQFLFVFLGNLLGVLGDMFLLPLLNSLLAVFQIAVKGGDNIRNACVFRKI